MSGIAEIDKSGRLVVPKKIRDAMHLRAGDRLRVDCEGGLLTMKREPQGKGLCKEKGFWVWDSGSPITNEDVLRWIDEDREARMRYVSGESSEP